MAIVVLALSLAKIYECQATTVKPPSSGEGSGSGGEPLELRRSQTSGRRRGAGGSGELSSLGKEAIHLLFFSSVVKQKKSHYINLY